MRSKLFEKQGTLRDHLTRFHALLHTIVDRGKAAGEFEPALPTAVVVATFMALLSPKVYEQLLREQQVDRAALVRAVGQIFFAGISTSVSH